MPSNTAPPSARPLMPWAGVLSYLVPGLGQIVQGRVAKGLLFFVCIYTLFFYGMYHGSGSVTVDDVTYRVNGCVYLPDNGGRDKGASNLSALWVNLYNRPQYVGQFWVGVVAWPALWQYFQADRQADGFRQGKKPRPAVEGAEANEDGQRQDVNLKGGDPLFGQFERAPSDEAINAIGTAGDKRLELAWVFTVIAGVLNIMVIYDAVAGPAFAQLGAGSSDRSQPRAA